MVILAVPILLDVSVYTLTYVLQKTVSPRMTLRLQCGMCKTLATVARVVITFFCSLHPVLSEFHPDYMIFRH